MNRGQSLDDGRTTRSHSRKDGTTSGSSFGSSNGDRTRSDSQSGLTSRQVSAAIGSGNSRGESRNADTSPIAKIAGDCSGNASSNGFAVRGESGQDGGHFAGRLVTTCAASRSSSGRVRSRSSGSRRLAVSSTASGTSRSTSSVTSTTAATSRCLDRNTSSSTDTDTIVNNLSGILSRANSRRAVSEAVKEVLVGTETSQVILFATELLSLVGAQHVGGAGLAAGCKVGRALSGSDRSQGAKGDNDGLHLGGDVVKKVDLNSIDKISLSAQRKSELMAFVE